jgi:hypothetical protein
MDFILMEKRKRRRSENDGEETKNLVLFWSLWTMYL